MMKRILTIVFLLVLNFTLKAQILQQPNTYGIGWKRTGADTLLYIPSDTLQVPSWGVGKTHIARKGTALYYWDGSKWSAITGSGSTYTAGNGLTLSGSQFKLGSPLTENTTITTTGYDFNLPGIPTVSSTTRRKVALIDTVTGKVERIDPSTLNSNIYNTDGTLTGDRSVNGNSKSLEIQDLGSFTVTAGTSGSGGFSIDGNGDYSVSIYRNGKDASLQVKSDSIIMKPFTGKLYIDTLNTVSSTTGRKVLVHDTATGKVERIDPASLVTTPTLQQVLTAGSTLTKNDTIYLNSYHLRILNNGEQYLVIDPTLNNEYAEFRSYNPTEVNDARLKVKTTNLLSNGQFEADFGDGVNVSRVELQSSSGVSKVILNAYNYGGGLNGSYLYVDLDSIYLRPEKGALNIDTLRTWSGISDTTYKKPMTWDTRNGRWEYAANWYGGGGGSVSSASGTGVSLVNGSSLIKRLKEGTGITITDNTDSVTVSRVSDSTMVRNLRWKYRNTLDYNEDYEAASFNRWVGSATGAGSTANDNSFTMPNWMLDYFGAVKNETGTTTTGSAISYYGAPSSGAGGTFRSENTKNLSFEVGRVLFPTLSDSTGGTDIYKAAFGLFDWWGSDITQSGIQVFYDRSSHGNYWAIRSDNGSVSTVVTTTPIEDSTRYTIRLEVSRFDLGNSGCSVRVYINDTEVVASSGTYPITTNIPAATFNGNPFYLGLYIKKSAGTNSRKMYADWTHIYAETVDR